MKSKLIKEAAKRIGYQSGMVQGVKEHFVDNAKKYAVGTGATASVGTGLAIKEDYENNDLEYTKSAVKTIAGVSGALAGSLGILKAGKLAGRLARGDRVFRTGNTSTAVGMMDTALMPNVITPNKKAAFYGGNPLGAVLEEVKSASIRVARQFFNPRHSVAHKKTGATLRNKELIDDFDNLLKEERLAMSNMQFKKGERGYVTELKNITDRIKQGVKVVHFKLINDASNDFIFANDAMRNYLDGQTGTALSEYAKRFLTPRTYKELTQQAGKPYSIGKESLDNMLKAQQFKTDITKMQYLQLDNKGVRMGDMLRDVQFEPRAYKLFGKMQNATKNSKTDFYNEAKKLFPNTKRLKNGKIQIIFSPQLKSNYDWGGNAGSIIWDARNPKKVQFFSTDGRDLFGMKLGKDVINVSPIREITIPEVVKMMKKNPVPRGPDKITRKKYTKQQYEAMSSKDMDKVVARSKLLGKDDLKAMRKIRDDYDEAYNAPLTPREIAQFTATRTGFVGGGVAGLVGGYALAEDILED
jgi:hypothetical protein